MAQPGSGGSRNENRPWPGLRPGRLGWSWRRSLEKGAAWRWPRRWAWSSWALREAIWFRNSASRSWKAAICFFKAAT